MRIDLRQTLKLYNGTDVTEQERKEEKNEKTGLIETKFIQVPITARKLLDTALDALRVTKSETPGMQDKVEQLTREQRGVIHQLRCKLYASNFFNPTQYEIDFILERANIAWESNAFFYGRCEELLKTGTQKYTDPKELEKEEAEPTEPTPENPSPQPAE